MENQKKKFKFNIVDAVVIVVILAVAAFFIMKFIDFRQVQPDMGAQKMSYTVRVDAMPRSMYEEIADKLPAQMISNGGYINGYVQSAEAEECGVTDIEFKDSQNPLSCYHVTPADDYVSVIFYCEANIDNSILNQVGSQEVRVGRSHYVKTHDVEVMGTIISVERSAAE